MNEDIELTVVRYVNRDANQQSKTTGSDFPVQLSNGDVERFRYNTRLGLHAEMSLENATLLEAIPEYQIGDRPVNPFHQPGAVDDHTSQMDRDAEVIRQSAQANSSTAALAAQVAALQAQLDARSLGNATITAIRSPLGWKQLQEAALDEIAQRDLRELAAVNNLDDEGAIVAVYKALGDLGKTDADIYMALEQAIEDSEFRKALAEETPKAVESAPLEKEAEQSAAATDVPAKKQMGRPKKVG
jgi:hypothetical protein